MWLLFVPILVVVLMFTGGIWLIGSAWPVLLIALGAWMLWHQDGRQYRRGRGWAAEQRQPLGWCGRPAGRTWPVARSSEDMRTRKAWKSESKSGPESKSGSESKSESKLKAELPIDLQVKVEQIRRKVEVLLGYADRFPPFSQDLHLVRQTASDYLPRTVNAFLSMPQDAVDTPMASNGGRTARQELTAQ